MTRKPLTNSARIVEWAKERGPFTTLDVSKELGILPTSAGGALASLLSNEIISFSGKTIKSPTGGNLKVYSFNQSKDVQAVFNPGRSLPVTTKDKTRASEGPELKTTGSDHGPLERFLYGFR